MSIRTVLTSVVPERSTRTYAVTVNDASGLPVPLSGIDTIRATLRDKATGFAFFVNLDVKNNNGGSMGATNGLFTFIVTQEMNKIVNPAQSPNKNEYRVLTLDFVYNTDNRETHEVEWPIEAFKDIV